MSLFMYFRCWPGFSDPFPFNRFNALPDNELPVALCNYAIELLNDPEVDDLIRQADQGKEEKLVEAVKKQAARRLGGGSSIKPLKRVTTSEYFRQKRQQDYGLPMICVLGRYLGWWHNRVLCDAGDGDKVFYPVPGPRIWFHEAKSSEFADAVIKRLEGRQTLDHTQYADEQHMKPRYGVVAADDLPKGGQASIRVDIGKLEKDERPDVPSSTTALYLGQRAIGVVKEIDSAWDDGDVASEQSNNPEAPPEEPEFLFVRNGEMYQIRAFGESGHFKANKGFRYLAMLLNLPNVSIPAVSLTGHGASDVNKQKDPHSWQDTLDPEAVRECRNHSASLESKIAEAEANGSHQVLRELQQEHEQIEKQLRADLGLRGRPRNLDIQATDKARQSVLQALSRAYKKLRSHGMTETVTHFEAAISSETNEFIYVPASSISWITTTHSS